MPRYKGRDKGYLSLIIIGCDRFICAYIRHINSFSKVNLLKEASVFLVTLIKNLPPTTTSELTAVINKMKSIRNQIKASVAVAAVTSMATLVNIPSAEAALYGLSWTGNQGYSAQGQFSYDDDFLGTVITRDELTDFRISFFDPTGNLLQNFNYDFPNPNSSFKNLE